MNVMQAMGVLAVIATSSIFTMQLKVVRVLKTQDVDVQKAEALDVVRDGTVAAEEKAAAAAFIEQPVGGEEWPFRTNNDSAVGICSDIMDSWLAYKPQNDTDYLAVQGYGAPYYSAPPSPTPKQGIAIFSGGARLPMALLTVEMLRKHLNCTLPIEIWYLQEELRTEPPLEDTYSDQGVAFRPVPWKCNFASFKWGTRWADQRGAKVMSHFQGKVVMKPLIVALSSFDEVLFLDDDVIPFTDPEQFFSYRREDETAVFWADLWSLIPSAPIWDALPYPGTNGTVPTNHTATSQDSGAMVVCKSCLGGRGWRSLLAAGYMNFHHKVYYPALYSVGDRKAHLQAAIGAGDKDTFQVGWQAVGDKYRMIGPVVILTRSGDVCGGVMGQTAPDGRVVLAHLTMHKLKSREPNKWRFWGPLHIGLQEEQRRAGDDPQGDGFETQTEVTWYPRPRNGHTGCIEYLTHHPQQNTTGLLPGYEEAILHTGKELYTSKPIKQFIQDLQPPPLPRRVPQPDSKKKFR